MNDETYPLVAKDKEGARLRAPWKRVLVGCVSSSYIQDVYISPAAET